MQSTESSRILLASHTHSLPYYAPPQSGKVVMISEPTSTHRNPPKAIVYVINHFCCCTFSGFGRMYDDTYPLSQCHREHLTALKILCAPPTRPSLPPAPANHWSFTVSIILPFPECRVIRIIQYVAFSDWLLLLSNTHLKFLHVCSWLDSSFLFSTEW